MDEAALRVDMIEGIEHQLGEPLEEPLLSALQRVPRGTFVSDAAESHAAGQLDSQTLAPATAVRFLRLLEVEPDDDVLVVGAGVGYTAAVLAEIAGEAHVHAIDIDREVVYAARATLAETGYDGVLVDCRDGAGGLPEYAPYDRILLEAGVVEPPRALQRQLADGGRLVFPRGTGTQTIVAAERTQSDTEEIEIVEEGGPAQLRPMLVDGEQSAIERNRTRREDAEFAGQGYFARSGWEQEWIDWDDQL